MQIVLIKRSFSKTTVIRFLKVQNEGSFLKTIVFPKTKRSFLKTKQKTIVLKTINTAAAARRFRSNKKSIYKNININILKVAKMLIKIYWQILKFIWIESGMGFEKVCRFFISSLSIIYFCKNSNKCLQTIFWVKE